MLSSIRSRRRFILASVKFLSRALTALNLEPSMATLATLSKPSSRHSATKVRQTSRIALPLSLRKSAMVLKSGASCPVCQTGAVFACHPRSIKRAAQRHEGTADLTNRLAVVLAEIRNGLEVRRQLPRQPDQLDVALAFALKAAARRNAIEIAINVYLEQGPRMIARPPLFQRLNPTKAKLAKIKTFNESVNRTNQIVLGHVVVKQRWEKCALAPVNPFHKA